MKDVTAVTTTLPRLGLARPSFASVAESELDAVHRYLLFLTGNRAVAEDLTSETFEKAFRAWRRFDPRRGSAKTWLCQIARSTALDHFRAERRRRRREDVYSAQGAAATDAPLVDGLSPDLDEAIRSLS